MPSRSCMLVGCRCLLPPCVIVKQHLVLRGDPQWRCSGIMGAEPTTQSALFHSRLRLGQVAHISVPCFQSEWCTTKCSKLPFKNVIFKKLCSFHCRDIGIILLNHSFRSEVWTHLWHPLLELVVMRQILCISHTPSQGSMAVFIPSSPVRGDKLFRRGCVTWLLPSCSQLVNYSSLSAWLPAPENPGFMHLRKQKHTQYKQLSLPLQSTWLSQV